MQKSTLFDGLYKFSILLLFSDHLISKLLSFLLQSSPPTFHLLSPNNTQTLSFSVDRKAWLWSSTASALSGCGFVTLFVFITDAKRVILLIGIFFFFLFISLILNKWSSSHAGIGQHQGLNSPLDTTHADVTRKKAANYGTLNRSHRTCLACIAVQSLPLTRAPRQITFCREIFTFEQLRSRTQISSFIPWPSGCLVNNFTNYRHPPSWGHQYHPHRSQKHTRSQVDTGCRRSYRFSALPCPS